MILVIHNSNTIEKNIHFNPQLKKRIVKNRGRLNSMDFQSSRVFGINDGSLRNLFFKQYISSNRNRIYS